MGLNDVLDRARREYDRERTAVMRHTQLCGWCLDGPCPMGRAVRENAEAYGRHLESLTARGGEATDTTTAHPSPACTRAEHIRVSTAAMQPAGRGTGTAP